MNQLKTFLAAVVLALWFVGFGLGIVTLTR